MMTRHTPGPWVAESNDIGGEVVSWRVYSTEGQEVARVHRWNGEGDAANARLIAKAPAMLAALREALVIAEDGVIERRETGKPTWYALDAIKTIARAAIAEVEEPTEHDIAKQKAAAWRAKAERGEHPGRGFCLTQAERWDAKARGR